MSKRKTGIETVADGIEAVADSIRRIGSASRSATRTTTGFSNSLSEMNYPLAVRNMTRAQLQDVLERYGFAVYDSETWNQLYDAVLANVDDGTIDKSVIVRIAEAG